MARVRGGAGGQCEGQRGWAGWARSSWGADWAACFPQQHAPVGKIRVRAARVGRVRVMGTGCASAHAASRAASPHSWAPTTAPCTLRPNPACCRRFWRRCWMMMCRWRACASHGGPPARVLLPISPAHPATSRPPVGASATSAALLSGAAGGQTQAPRALPLTAPRPACPLRVLQGGGRQSQGLRGRGRGGGGRGRQVRAGGRAGRAPRIAFIVLIARAAWTAWVVPGAHRTSNPPQHLPPALHLSIITNPPTPEPDSSPSVHPICRWPWTWARCSLLPGSFHLEKLTPRVQPNYPFHPMRRWPWTWTRTRWGRQKT